MLLVVAMFDEGEMLPSALMYIVPEALAVFTLFAHPRIIMSKEIENRIAKSFFLIQLPSQAKLNVTTVSFLCLSMVPLHTEVALTFLPDPMVHMSRKRSLGESIICVR